MANKVKICKTCKEENTEEAVVCTKCGSKELTLQRKQSSFIDECAG